MKQNKGFSLVELIVVIAIMAILVGVAVPVYTSYINNAKEAKDAQYLDELSRAAQIFAAEKGLELQSIWVAPVVEADKGVVLVLADGTTYADDMQKFYSMIGAYDFETINTNQQIKYFEDETLPDEPFVPEAGDADCAHEMEIVEEATCFVDGYKKCTNCAHTETIPHGHKLTEEDVGNMHITRCEQCTYFEYEFHGNSLGGR